MCCNPEHKKRPVNITRHHLRESFSVCTNVVALLGKNCAPFADNKATVNCVHHTKLPIWSLGLKHVPNMVAISHSV